MRSSVVDCNVLCGIAEGLLSRLQSVQNAAARLVTGLGRREHIRPVLRQLHWLVVRQRVMFKLATLVSRSLAGTAPAYLSDECHLTSSVGVRSCVQLTPEHVYLVEHTMVAVFVEQSAAAASRTGHFIRFKTMLKTFCFS